MGFDNVAAAQEAPQRPSPSKAGSAPDGLDAYRSLESPTRPEQDKTIQSKGSEAGRNNPAGGDGGPFGGTSGGASVFHMNDAFPHPQNAEQAVWESRSIEMNANAALHSTNGRAAAAEFQRIADTLKGMSPSEQALMFKQLQTIGDAIQDTGVREQNRHGLPDVTINRDANGDVTDITFKSLSDDASYGKSHTVNLDETHDTKSKDGDAQGGF